jgi:hypothetical protein
VSTARELEDAIRSLPGAERDKLLHKIPDLFPELSGDAQWERIIADERPRPALTALLDKTEAEFRRDPGKFPKLTERELSSPS